MIVLLCQMHCTISSVVDLKCFLKTFYMSIASTSFLSPELPLFLPSHSQIHNFFFLQLVYNLLCPFSFDVMKMCPCLTT